MIYNSFYLDELEQSIVFANLIIFHREFCCRIGKKFYQFLAYKLIFIIHNRIYTGIHVS